MKMFFTFFKIELKRVFKTFPKLLIGAAALILVISGVAFCSRNFLYKSSATINVNIGLVVNDDSYWTNLGVDTVLGSESTSMINFIKTDEASAREMISKGTVIAAIILPDKIASSIISGENKPITILFPENSGLEAVVISELTSAAARILTAFQSSVYAAEDFCYKYSTAEVSDRLNYKLNMYFLSNALSRESLFRETYVEATGNIPIDRYYTASAIVLFMLFFGITLNGYYDSFSKSASLMLKRKNLNGFCQGLIHTITAFFVLCLIIIPILGIAIVFFKDFFTMNILLFFLSLILSMLIASVCITLLYRIFGTGINGILAISGITVITGFMSGLFIPFSLLPGFVTAPGSMTPTGIMFRIILHFII